MLIHKLCLFIPDPNQPLFLSKTNQIAQLLLQVVYNNDRVDLTFL